MGTAIAHVLASQGQEVSIWDHFPEVIQSMRHKRVNHRFLPGIHLHGNITVCDSAQECVATAGILVICVPSAFTTQTLLPLVRYLEPGAILLNVAKGFAPGSMQLMPNHLEEIAPGHPCVHLAGPAIANEFVRGLTASVVMASSSNEAAETVAAKFSGPAFQVTVTKDLVGAALAGIMKNTYAILLGCLEEMGGKSRNLESAASTASIREMAAIAEACGDRQKRFMASLAWVTY